MSLKTSKQKWTAFKIIAMTLIVIFSLLLVVSIVCFVSIIIGMEKYGGEMADGIGLLMLLPILLHLTIFAFWSYRIYRLEVLKRYTYLQLGVISLLGLIAPFLFLVS